MAKDGKGGLGRGGGRPFRTLSPAFAAYLKHYWPLNDGAMTVNPPYNRNLAQPKFPIRQYNATRAFRSVCIRGTPGVPGWDSASGSDRLVADTPSTSGENLGKNMTAGVWCRPDNRADWKAVIMKGTFNAAPQNFTLDLSNSGPSPVARFYFTVSNVYKAVTGSTVIPLISPATLLVGTYDGVTIKLYVNGYLDGSLAESGTPDTNAGSIAVGSGDNGGAGAVGSDFAHPFVMNRALHQGEILRLAQMGPDAFLIPDVFYPPLAPEGEGPEPPAGGASILGGTGSLLGGLTQIGSTVHGGAIPGGTGPLEGGFH